MPVYHSAVRSDPVASKLLDAARTLLETNRLEDITIRAISELAGVSTINVYTRFGSKDGILDVLHREGYEELRRRFEAITGLSSRDTLRAMTEMYRDFVLESRSRHRIMFEGSDRGFEASPDAAAASRSAMLPVIELVRTAIDRGETILPAGSDPIPVVGGFWALAHGATTLELRGTGSRVIDWPTALFETLERMLDALFPDPS